MERSVRGWQKRFYSLPPTPSPPAVRSFIAIIVGVEGGWAMAEINRRK